MSTAFNSFEDETSIPFSPVLQTISELSIPLRMKLGEFEFVNIYILYDFQFLWGWNNEGKPMLLRFYHRTFNSFEDETNLLEAWWKWRSPFNSFEDETMSQNGTVYTTYSTLSIPLRMKSGVQWPSPRWSLTWLSIPLRMKLDFYQTVFRKES